MKINLCVWRGTIETPHGKKQGVISKLPISIYASHESNKQIGSLFGIMKAVNYCLGKRAKKSCLEHYNCNYT